MQELTLKRLTTELKNTGITPFERRIKYGYNCLSQQARSIFVDLQANTLSGVFQSDVYNRPLDSSNVCYDLFKYELSLLCGDYRLKKMQEDSDGAEFKPLECWLYAFPKFLEGNGEKIKKILTTVTSRYDCSELLSNITIVFPVSVLWLEKDNLQSVTNIAESKCKVAVMDVGDKFCPITSLSAVKFDYVMLSENVVNELIGGVNVKSIVAMTEYIKAFNSKIYASGNFEVKQIEKLAKYNIYAFFTKEVKQVENFLENVDERS